MATNERSPHQIRLLTALLLFGTFLFGAVAGAGFFRWMQPPHGPWRPPFLPGPPGALQLTPVQEAKTKEITDRYRPQLEAIVRENFPRLQAINEQMEKELREILTPKQRQKLDEMKAHRPPMPPPEGMPMPPPGRHGERPPEGGPPPWPPGIMPLPPEGAPPPP